MVSLTSPTYVPNEMPGAAVVTGGASGLGRAVAHSFAHAGCTRIALLDLNQTGLESVRSSILYENKAKEGFQVLILVCDVSDESSVITAFDHIRREFKRLDYAVNCAGVPATPYPSDALSVHDFDRNVAINLRGVFLCSREELRIMKSQTLDSEVYPDIPPVRAQRGAIVNIASGLALAAMGNSADYCASKAGVLGLTRADALDSSAFRIRVNSVLPGATETPMSHAVESTRKAIEAHAVNVMTPLKRWGKPEEIADTCLFLCSNKASFIQGVSLPVDGGYLAI